MLPRAFKTLYRRDVRYSRTGIYLGDIKKSGKFVPRTAFALSIGADDFTNTISFDANDPNVIKFLKGETITIDGSDNSLTLLRKGIVLVCVDGFPLGFTQNDGQKLKNLYEKGWIYR